MILFFTHFLKKIISLILHFIIWVNHITTFVSGFCSELTRFTVADIPWGAKMHTISKCCAISCLCTFVHTTWSASSHSLLDNTSWAFASETVSNLYSQVKWAILYFGNLPQCLTFCWRHFTDRPYSPNYKTLTFSEKLFTTRVWRWEERLVMVRNLSFLLLKNRWGNGASPVGQIVLSSRRWKKTSLSISQHTYFSSRGPTNVNSI